MDSIEFLVLSELLQDPEIPFSRIAKKLGISQNTVKKKYLKMLENGIIIGSSVVVDLSKIGFEGKADFSIITENGKESTIKALKKIPNVFLITETLGDYEIKAMAAVKNYTSMMKLVKEIQEIPTVKQVEVQLKTDTTFPVCDQYKKILPYLILSNNKSSK